MQNNNTKLHDAAPKPSLYEYINAVNNNGQTALHYASQGGHIKTVEFLVSMRANVDKKDNNGQTPLHLATQEGHIKVVEFLMSLGANIHAVNNNGQTPLHLAARGLCLDEEPPISPTAC